MIDKEALYLDVYISTSSQAFDISLEGGGEGRFPYYDGSYVVDPRKVAQTLSTANKSMRDDVVVNEIFYSEVGNVSGGNTAYIGME